MPTIEVTNKQLEEIRNLKVLDEVTEFNALDDLIGAKLLIRTVTHYWTGEVVARVGDLIQLKDAAWIADTGRFADALKTGKLNEVEPVGEAWVNIGAVVDFTRWNHALPKEQK